MGGWRFGEGGGEQGKHKATAGLHQRERERETTTTRKANLTITLKRRNMTDHVGVGDRAGSVE